MTEEQDGANASQIDAGDGDEWDEEESILTWKLLVGIVVVLVVVAVAAMTLFGKKSDDTAESSTSTTAPSGLANVPSIRDDFSRPDNSASLGRTSTGEDWEAALGTWGVTGNEAYVAQKNAGPRNIALVDLAQGDTGSVGATAAKMVNGWGLVFRYRGPNAYWYIAATPLGDKPTAGFNMFKVEDGSPTNVKANCIKQLQDDSKVRVEFSGTLITVFVDDKAVCTVKDPYLQNQSKVGLFVTEQGVADARWSDFLATKGLGDGPPVTAKPPASTSTTAAGGAAGTAAPTTTQTTAAP